MSSSIWVAIGLLINVVLLFCFSVWMKAPTLKGRELLDQLDGYKRWLNEHLPQQLAETANDEQARNLIDEHLPWITALGLGGTWGEKLATVLGTAAVAGGATAWHRHPHWYHGNDWQGLDSLGSFTSSISSGVSSAISSSSSSSSSSGGGSSGGGGGGGGGGGW